MRPLLLLFLSLCVVSGCTSGNEDDRLETRAREIHANAITIDSHDDIEFDFATEAVNPCVRGDRQVDLIKMKEGGLDVAFFIVYVGQEERNDSTYAKAKADAMVKFDAIHRLAEEMCPEQIELAESAADVERIVSEGKLVAAIGIENGFVIGKDLSLVETYHDLGARYITLAHGGHNDIADSATPRDELDAGPSEHGGVSAFGEEVIAEMNRVGIMVDVSHISKDAMMDAVRVSRAPVIASHSSTRAIADNPRNMDDEQLRALAKNGGVIQMVALGQYVKADAPEKMEATTALREEFGLTSFAAWRALSDSARSAYMEQAAALDLEYPGANVSDFVDHIDHAVDLIGVDHVGISSDFDGGGGIDGWRDASETLNVTLELVRRGYSEEDITKMWGGNLLRVWREVERIAAQLQSGG
jgi:membrane dipeptidase